MPREGDKWRVARGDCLWNISKTVYNNPRRWTEIADANGVSRKTALIYPGQMLSLPGITGGAPAPAPAPADPPVPSPASQITRPNIDWFTLIAGSSREMIALWSYNANHFWIRWEQWDNSGHLIMISETRNGDYTNTHRQSIASGRDTQGWNVFRFSVRPVDENGNPLPNTDWAYKEYDFRDNPPELPPDPEFSINNSNELTVTLSNISENINADSIEIAIYRDDTIKDRTVKVNINTETNFARYIGTVDPGHYYKVRCRAVRGNIYGGWTNFTSNDLSLPVAPTSITTLRPQTISEQQAQTYGVFIEWPSEKTAKIYEVQWTTNVQYFDISQNVSSQTTEEGEGPRLLITNIELGHEYFFRVRSINDKGNSLNWTPIRSVKLGSKPSAPTTWSNVSSAVLGEDLNLYWTHNSTDGSYETFARLHITVIDSAHPSAQPIEYTKVIENTRSEEEKNSNSVYTINTNSQEWSGVHDGFIIKWKVQTTGIIGEYSEWSIEREVSVYAKPNLAIDIINKNDLSIDEVNNFPFYISLLATPATQKPISYYIEVISNDGYSTVDNVGEFKVINPGDKVYQKYIDPDRNAWHILAEMSPSNIDLQTNINYTINATVAMDSGLSITTSKSFNVIFDESGYSPYGIVNIDKESLSASICPYCMENYETNGTIQQRLSQNCKLSVYRREYDGTFTEIATNVINDKKTYVVDPHPSLDYARYRIVAKTNDTGTISYCDIESVKVGEPSIVIQWSEKWSQFDYDPDDSGSKLEVPWAGSMLKLLYNVDISESKNMDVSLVKYVGRKNPVSYYGTQLGETATWNTDVPAEDKETLYAIRRLSRWTGDVYVREPSGTGYWANISVSLSKKHNDVIIPVTFNIKRVEGGI